MFPTCVLLSTMQNLQVPQPPEKNTISLLKMLRPLSFMQHTNNQQIWPFSTLIFHSISASLKRFLDAIIFHPSLYINFAIEENLSLLLAWLSTTPLRRSMPGAWWISRIRHCRQNHSFFKFCWPAILEEFSLFLRNSFDSLIQPLFVFFFQ